MKTKWQLWSSVLAGLLLAGAAHATTYSVTNLVDGDLDSLRGYITRAHSGDTIDINVSGTMLLGNELDITNNLTIVGPGTGALTISGQNHSRVFNIAAGATVTISQLTVSDGLASDGGGILNAGTLTLQNCTISNNKSQNAMLADGGGGGIESYGSSLTLVNCLVTSNTISTRDYGGGIDVTLGTLTMTNCTLSFNSVVSSGGGIYFESGSAELVNCTVANNSATGGGQGGGIETLLDSMILMGCTISGNSAEQSGGGLDIYDATITIENTIIGGNSAGSNSDVQIGLFGGNIVSGGFNFIGDARGAAGTVWTNGDQIGPTKDLFPLDAKLGPLQDNGGPTPTMAPSIDSPVVDAGYSFGLTTDQRSAPRPFVYLNQAFPTGGDGSDIGAVELNYNPVLKAELTGPNKLAVSWPTPLAFVNLSPTNHWTNAPVFGVQKKSKFTVGTEWAPHINPVRIVDFQFKTKDYSVDSSGATIGSQFYRLTTGVTNPFYGPPITGSASNIMAHTATLNGTDIPAGSNTVYWFVYGTDTKYGTFTVTNPLAISTNPTPVSVNISGLTASTNYHYQLMASDSDLPGLQYGGDQTFTTLASAATNWALFVSSSGNNAIYKFNSNGVPTAFATNGLNGAVVTNAQGLALDALGDLYVVNYGSYSVEKFDALGNGSLFKILNLGDGYFGVALDSANNLFVADNTASKILKITGGQVSTFASYASGATVNGPTGVTFDGAGNLWVANNYGGWIEKFDSLGNGTQFYKYSANPGPFALAFDSAGNLYVTEANIGKVGKFAAGTTNRTDFATGLSSPYGLAFDSAGNLYVACSANNSIVKITPQGTPSVFANASTGLKSPAFIAIQQTH